MFLWPVICVICFQVWRLQNECTSSHSDCERDGRPIEQVVAEPVPGERWQQRVPVHPADPVQWCEYPYSDVSTRTVMGVPVQWYEYPYSDGSTRCLMWVPVQWCEYPYSDVSTHTVMWVLAVWCEYSLLCVHLLSLTCFNGGPTSCPSDA